MLIAKEKTNLDNNRLEVLQIKLLKITTFLNFLFSVNYRWFFLSFLILISCSQPQKKEEFPTIALVQKKEIADIVVDPYWENLKNFLISKTEILDESLQTYTQKDWYKEYQRNLQFYVKTLRSRETLIRTWHEVHLKKTKEIPNAFYLLSGSDVFHLVIFYPEAENYIFVSLENPGLLQRQYSEKDLKYGIFSLQQILANLTQAGYLYSRVMKEYLENQKNISFSGTLPIFLFFIGYFDWKIQDVKSQCLKFSMNQCETPMIVYHTFDSQSRRRTLYYISQKLKPEDFQMDSEISKFFLSFPERGLFLKSAVYLFHFPSYRKVNFYLRETFSMIIQDDSGIPYEYIKNFYTNIYLFGQYKEPTNLKGTINPFQNDLYQDYQKTPIKQLPFDFGYTQRKVSRMSNLIYAYR